jgi:prephenate dehydrogenase
MTGTSLGICGLGLIGSSIARAWLAKGPVWALDPDPQALRLAESVGVRPASSLAEIAQADLVVLAAPTAMNTALLTDLMAGELRPTTMDVGSAKELIVKTWRQQDQTFPFVATHPMAGSELAGFEAGNSQLFADATWPLIVDEATDAKALSSVLSVILALGAWPIPVSGSTHDRIVAEISHLPHLLAGALGQFVAQSDATALAVRLAAGSFRDVSRVSASPPQRTAEFISANRTEAAARARSAAQVLLEAADLLSGQDELGLREWLSVGNRIRTDYETRGQQTHWQVSGMTDSDVKAALLRQLDSGNRVIEFMADPGGWHMTLAGLPEFDNGH